MKTLPVKLLGSKIFFYVFKNQSYAHQGCIYLIKKYSKNAYIVKFYYNLKYLFSICKSFQN